MSRLFFTARRSKQRGTLLSPEIMATLILLGAIMMMVGQVLLPGLMRTRAVVESKEKKLLLDRVLNTVWLINLEYAENNCYGWTDPACANLALTPQRVSGDPSQIDVRFYAGGSVSLEAILGKFKDAGCFVTGGVNDLGNNVYSIILTCYDGYGAKVLWSFGSYHEAGENFEEVYTNPVSITISYMKNRRSEMIDYSEAQAISYQRSLDKAYVLASALKAFVRRKKMLEVANTCTEEGGLNSWEDALVPWVWMVLSSQPDALCSGNEPPTSGDENAQPVQCGCSDFDENVWRRSNGWGVVNSTNEWNVVLSNLSLPVKYRVDGFGNALLLVPIADSEGMAVQFVSTGGFYPPRPRPFVCAVSGSPCYSTIAEIFYTQDLRVWGSVIRTLNGAFFQKVIYE